MLCVQVAPAELEDALRSLLGVEDVAVVGVASPREGEGELPRAFIVRANNQVTSETPCC